ncbi:TlpA disulfide reductase family protein [Herminiimonas fonticola]|uniref:TlpA disulfide reductase family protein n=1 Tax=Herminiimonas fonticola TaxID=303380 RepID=UPI00333F464F
MKRNVFLFGIFALVFAGIGIYFGNRHHTPAAPESPAVATFFAQQLEDADGKMHTLSQWQGKTLIVNFWATWCAPCVEEMPELTALQTELAPHGIQILGVGIDNPTNIREFAAKYKITYPLYIAGMTGSELSRQFGNQAGGLPFTVIIGPNGDIKKTYLGRLKMEQLRADIHSL